MRTIVYRMFLAIVALGVLGAILWAFRPQPVAVDVETVSRGPLEVTVDEDGRTRIRDRYVVSAPLAAQLQRIELDAGDVVVAGETIVAVLEPVDPSLLDARAALEAEATVRRAEAAVARAQAEFAAASARQQYAAVELDRIQTAFNQGAANQSEADDALVADRTSRADLDAAKFARKIAEFELELAQAALIRTQPADQEGSTPEYLTIKSPINGRVLRVMQQSAAVVTPGTALLELGNPADLEMEVDVLSTDAVQIQPGAPVHIERWGGDEPLNGIVRLVEPQAFTKISALGVEEQRVNIIIDFVDPPEKWKALGDGYRIEARIVTWHDLNVLKVPAGALFRQGPQWSLFVVRDGKAVVQPVKPGQRTMLEVRILDGLEAGETVIVHPSDQVADGITVAPRHQP